MKIRNLKKIALKVTKANIKNKTIGTGSTVLPFSFSGVFSRICITGWGKEGCTAFFEYDTLRYIDGCGNKNPRHYSIKNNSKIAGLLKREGIPISNGMRTTNGYERYPLDHAPMINGTEYLENKKKDIEAYVVGDIIVYELSGYPWRKQQFKSEDEANIQFSIMKNNKEWIMCYLEESALWRELRDLPVFQR